MWTYHQENGLLEHEGYPIIKAKSHGYAGCGSGKDNPAAQYDHGSNPPKRKQCRPGAGPLPQGYYKIGKPHNNPNVGLYALRLEPDPHNKMFGRHSFYIHGDNQAHPGASSDGCIVVSLDVRKQIVHSSDDDLEVIR